MEYSLAAAVLVVNVLLYAIVLRRRGVGGASAHTGISEVPPAEEP
jgi:hypothetical protein